MATYGEINLIENSIQDPAALENFKRIKVFLRDENVIKTGFVFRTFEVPAALISNFKFKHNLNFVPRDVIVSSILNDATITWHFNNFDKDYIYLSTSAATTLRVFLGTYKDNNS